MDFTGNAVTLVLKMELSALLGKEDVTAHLSHASSSGVGRISIWAACCRECCSSSEFLQEALCPLTVFCSQSAVIFISVFTRYLLSTYSGQDIVIVVRNPEVSLHVTSVGRESRTDNL